ncbi:forkhead box protein I2-like [Patiria miniata]|uniref:Fork-head domain-containing protein n=1 Tax=Patiria miniata TaxID=46514 RepID=A0A914BM59_PATMI|nr:forkhead box protein I2-like [Patiria miniata]
MARSSPPNDCDTLRSTAPVKTKSRRPNYRRRVKLPHTFAELITMAIKESETGKLTLKEIQSHMSASHDCFRGAYSGWKNSVRHNLSTCSCFVKVLKNKAQPNGKDNYWALNPDCPHCVMLKSRHSFHQSAGASTGTGRSSSEVSASNPPDTKTATRNLHKSSSPPTTQNVATTAAHTSSNPTTPLTAQPTPLHSINRDFLVGRAGVPVNQPESSQGHQLSSKPQPTVSTASLPTNEWNLPMSGLYNPDGEIDLSLYGDDAWPSSESRQSFHTSTGHFHQEHQRDIKPKALSTWMGSGIYPPYHSLSTEGALPRTAPYPQPAKIRIKSEYVAASSHRYHPYHAAQTFGSFRDRRVDYSCYSVSRSEPGHHYGPRWADDSRTVPNSSQGDSVVVSAIRSSLGLDLDEMALYAIEHSVRVLDVTRPCDLMSA